MPTDYGPGEKPLHLRRRTDGSTEFISQAPETYTFDRPTVARNSQPQPLYRDENHIVVTEGGTPQAVVVPVQVGTIAPFMSYDENAGTVTVSCTNATAVYTVTVSEDPTDRAMPGTLLSIEEN